MYRGKIVDILQAGQVTKEEVGLLIGRDQTYACLIA